MINIKDIEVSKLDYLQGINSEYTELKHNLNVHDEFKNVHKRI